MLSSLGKGLLAGAACIAAGAWLGCRSHDVERPNVILVVVETLRADAVRPGDSDSPMPFLSDLATLSDAALAWIDAPGRPQSPFFL